MLPAFLARYPEVRVILAFDNHPIVQLPDDVDVAIRAGALPDSALVARRLTATTLVTCASPRYLAAHGTPSTPDDLRRHRLVDLRDRDSIWRFRTPSGGVLELEPVPALVVPEHVIARTVILGDAGIGRLPEYYARDPIAQGTLIPVLTDYVGDRVDVHALYPRHRNMSATLRVFLDMLVTHFAARDS